MNWISVVFLLASVLAVSPSKDFTGYTVLTVNFENEAQVEAVKNVNKLMAEPLDFWKGGPAVGTVADIMVSSEDKLNFENLLHNVDMKFNVKVENVQSLIDNERNRFAPRAMEWTDYHDFDEIMTWLDEQVAAYPDYLTSLNIRETLEGRPMKGVKLSKKNGNPAIFVEANTHAREWITAASATWILNQLLTSTDANVQRLSEDYDWYFFPIVNPDGYDYSRKTNRMWRKNRSRNGLICYGTDPNRNWGYQWEAGSVGSSDNICDETFAGTGPFSEPETKSVSDFLLANRFTIKMFLSFHSYGQLMLYPWSYTSEPAEDAALLKEIGDAAAAELQSIHGTEYTVQSSFELYEHRGTSVDWTYGAAGIRASFTYEFRDTGSYGFILPADQIIPNAEEVLASLIVLIDKAQENNLFE